MGGGTGRGIPHGGRGRFARVTGNENNQNAAKSWVKRVHCGHASLIVQPCAY